MLSFFNKQIAIWPDAAARYAALQLCRRRAVKLNSLEGEPEIILLFNPARAVSTAAKVDAASIAKRPCFLCGKNRPQQQIVNDALQSAGFEILVNPFPILNHHFTIVNNRHIPQDEYPVKAMIQAAELFPDFAFFYNGARAGASAPDHLHFQAVPKTYIPLLEIVSLKHSSHKKDIIWSGHLGVFHPAGFWSMKGDEQTITSLPAVPDKDLSNLFVWKEGEDTLRGMLFPRRRHRAASYPNPMVSPGALDVAGLMVTVKEDDFNNLTPDLIADIYKATCYSPTETPSPV